MNTRVLIPCAFLLAAACADGSKGPGIKVDLVFEDSVSDAAVASIDRLILRSTETGAQPYEITPGRSLRRRGESFLYRAARAGQVFRLDVTALAMGNQVACGGREDLVATEGNTAITTVSLSACTGSADAGTGDAPVERADGGDADGSEDPRDAAADGEPRDAGDGDGARDAPEAAPVPVDAYPPQALGAACAADEHCQSQFCAAGVCCSQRCAGPCQSCSATGACVDIPPATCAGMEPITEVSPLQCTGGGYNPEGDGPLRGSNRSAAGDWQLSLTIGDPSPACVRNAATDPPCAAGDWEVSLGFGAATAP